MTAIDQSNEARIAELERDKERLDWVIRNYLILGRVFRFCDAKWTPRDAIDHEREIIP